MQFDVLIVGAGPVGLSLAAMVADFGLHVAIFDRQPLAKIEKPVYDGREIALSEKSIRILESMGAWERIEPQDTYPIRQAMVVDGDSPFALTFDPRTAGAEQLGRIVSNHLIRKSLMEVVAERPEITLFAEIEVIQLDRNSKRATVTLGDGSTHSAALAVAADTRFSQIRRDAGITAASHDFGHTMIVGRMHHEMSHANLAREMFLYDGGLAILPLKDHVSSVVQTFPAETARRFMEMDEKSYACETEKRLHGALGKMRCVDKRVSYPLVGVYAHHFAANRLALIGDAAVGMHPVTAHGFNFGVQGAHNLASKLRKVHKRGGDLGEARTLKAFEAEHRRLTWPLYEFTLRMMQLYTSTSLPAKLARKGAIRAAQILVPGKRLLLGKLTQRSLPEFLGAQFR
jgi:ubiquinone biosynthesis UbiH/UbiF/VisC/COQ6 family hydroxylase